MQKADVTDEFAEAVTDCIGCGYYIIQISPKGGHPIKNGVHQTDPRMRPDVRSGWERHLGLRGTTN